MRSVFVILGAAILLTGVIAVAVTANLCGADFAWHMNEYGNCGTTDAPSEVLRSFFVLAAIPALGLALLLRRLGRGPR